MILEIRGRRLYSSPYWILKRAFDFGGRSNRPDYKWSLWLMSLLLFLLFCVLIPFFSNVDVSDPALLNNPTELQK